MVRARVNYDGYVQGVGFRFTAQMIARSFPVSGYVANLPNGHVELVAEGEKADVDAFLARVSERMERHIDRETVLWEPFTGEFSGFALQY